MAKKEIEQLQGTKQLLDEKGPKAVADWLKQQEDVLITDTTFRDAHQSLLATRVRTLYLEAVRFLSLPLLVLVMFHKSVSDVFQHLENH